MYTSNNKFDAKGKKAKKIKKCLNVMSKALENSPPEMDIKWGFVDLYLLISFLMENYVIAGREADIADFFVGFETDRRAVDDPADLILSGNPYDKDLSDYIAAFVTGGGSEEER